MKKLTAADEDFTELTDKFSKVIVQCLLKPEALFWGAFGFRKPINFYEDSPNIAWVSVKEVGFSKEFVKSATIEQLLFVYLHECTHIALNHLCRKSAMGKHPIVWNWAQDYRINYDLVTLLKFDFDKIAKDFGGLYDTKYSEGWTAERIYEDLIAQIPESKLPELGNSGEFSDVELSEITEEEHIIEVSNAIATAKAANPNISIPSEFMILADQYANPKVDPTVLLKKTVASKLAKGLDFTRRSRRSREVFMPARRSKIPEKVAMFVDVSGSVSDSDIQDYVNDIYSFFRKKAVSTVEFIQFSTSLVSQDTFKRANDVANVTIKGRGGTDVQPVIDWIAKHSPRVALIYTDGYFSSPNIPALKTHIIWCIKGNSSFNSTIGTVIHYD